MIKLSDELHIDKDISMNRLLLLHTPCWKKFRRASGSYSFCWQTWNYKKVAICFSCRKKLDKDLVLQAIFIGVHTGAS